MGKRNPIHVLTQLLVILASYVSAKHYYIVPNDSTRQCQRYSAGTCFTLAEFASNSSYLDQDNYTLSFLRGEHLLTKRLTTSGPHSITLTGQNTSNSLSTIKCQGTSGFEFKDIQSLNIEYLKFTGCGNVRHGGAIYIRRTDNVLIRGCHFTDNHVVGHTSKGGVLYAYRVGVNIQESFFDNNYADGQYSFGGAIYVRSGNIYSTNDQYINNSAVSAGAIYVRSGNISSTSDQYINNSAADYGGAICVRSGNISSTNDQYINNSAADCGGAICVRSGNISSTSDQYINNSADIDGGAIYVVSGNVYSTSDQYINNSADIDGGAIYVWYGNISSTSDQYINNSAALGGGALYVVESGNINSTSDQYINNSAKHGGAIGSSNNINNNNNIILYSASNQYINNSAAHDGGAIYVRSGNISSTSDQYINNSAADRGGAIYDASGSVDTKFNGANFEHNSAVGGAAIYKIGGALVIGQSNITDNFASSKSTVYMNSGSLSLSEGVFFINNQGSLCVFNTQVEFIGAVIFTNNFGDSGGAITAFLSKISFNTASTVTICNNTATNGGGISLTQSNLQVYISIELTDNHATEFGGGIYAYQSDVEFKPERKQRSEITKNTASNGGAICAIASNIYISNINMSVNSNVAKDNGGAIHLEQNSKIYVQKHEPENIYTGLKVRLDFTSNSAEKGGAIYIADNTNDGVICQGANTETYQTECFIQTLGLHQTFDKLSNDFIYVLINTFFTNNTARKSGSDIYGGLLDRCTINQNAELVRSFPNFKNLSGFDYVKATTQIEQITDYSYHSRTYYDTEDISQGVDYLIGTISRSNVKGLISSDAVRVEFCLDNVIYPNYSHPNVLIKKGEIFTVSLVAVDQVGNPQNATIINSFHSKRGNGQLKAGQVEQQVGSQCTELEYNVYSQDKSAQIHIHADGPCGDKGVSRKTLNVIFLPCTCPVGFEPSPGPSEINCICECDQKLTEHQISSCSAENQTILVETNVWIGLSNYTNETEFVIHDCPFDYCVEKPVNISLSSLNSANKQCAYNRTGILCGMCQKDLSLVFGSSRCKECSDNYISFLILFALAGIALVAFILLLNLTVATGTIHGLIFYANILTANHSLFLPLATSNILTVFISWLNLDLGIEICFYDGMDSYGNFLLQLAFPTYVFVLIGTIIALCEVSKKFATLLGNRNPVAVLCTLILLSYSKLIRTIITALQFTHLEYPDGPREIVWLYDANVEYFTVSHIPRFIAAFIIIILGATYTILLLFGQWFPRCSKRKIMKWTKNTKYNAFIDAYHAPFTPKHRYWFGLLLFAQLTHNLVAAMSPDSLIAILSAGCVAHGLILLKLLTNARIYKNRLQDSLETISLTNIVILAIATFYIRENNEDQMVTYHIIETNEGQLALANTSMAISFILFLVILSYHFYKYILKGTQVWVIVTQCCQRKEHAPNRCQMYQLAPIEDEEPIFNQDTLDSNNQLREPAMDILDPVYTEDYRVTPPPPVIYKPPKVTYTVIDAIPRRESRVPLQCGPAEQNVQEVE